MGYNTEILLRRKNTIVVSPNEPGHTNAGVVAAFNLNLQQLGYTLSPAAIRQLRLTRAVAAIPLANEVIDLLTKARGSGAGLAHPMYPNFPIQVAEASDAELYLNAFFHYFSVWAADVTNNPDYIWLPRYSKASRTFLTYKVKLTVLNVVPNGDTALREIQQQLVTSNTSLSAQDKKDVAELVASGFTIGFDHNIPNKENLSIYAAAIVQRRDPIFNEWFKTGTDVLRLATALSGGDVSLKDDTKFVSFPRYQRRLLLNLLNQDKNLQESFSRDRQRFIRLGERLHPRALKGLEYRNVKNAFSILRAGARLITYNSEVEQLIKDRRIYPAVSLLEKRPGEFARRLDHLLTISPSPRVVQSFANVANRVSTPVLLQVKTHFENRNKQSIRVIMPKGNISKIQAIEGVRPRIDADICDAVAGAAEAALVSKFSELPSLGRVYVDPELKNYLVPFSQRSASAGLRTIVRGSQIPFSDEKDTVRFFVHWKNYKGAGVYGDGRVDLDLSATMYDQQWNDKGRVWYGNLREAGYKAYHSGDITNAPNGAAEFIDLDIPSMLRYGTRYVVMNVNMFAGPDNLSEVPECFAGWMLREQPQSGEVFEPKTVVDKIDITSPSRAVIPMIIDIQERRVIWVDSEISETARWGSNVLNQAQKIVLVGKAFTQITKPNLFDLFSLHAVARGRITQKESIADTVFSTKQGIQFDLAKIASEYLTN